MLLMTVVQRGIGFLRGIWFCRLLEDSEVGQWSMAFGFITMMTPLMMFGLPGAMPRYVERYRMAGHLTKFIWRVVLGTLVGAALLTAAMIIAPDQFAWLIFREPSSVSLIWMVAVAVIVTLVFNFINELVSSLRQVRLVSLMQFLQGVGFTAFGLAAIYAGGGLREIVIAYTVSTLLATAPGIWVLIRGWSGLPVSDERFDTKQMWRSLMPYAIALWFMNLLSNAFEMSDRYMILHLMPGGDEAANSAVGQYHSGRLIPTLMTSLATMFVGVLMPYLSADWERGHHQAVKEKLRKALFGVSIGFTVCAAIAIALSPILFESLLDSRYREGFAMQPMAFTFCIWGAIVTLAQTFLWIRERGNLVGFALAVGLTVNFALNYLWLPTWGLGGAVAATLVSNGVVLVGMGVALHSVGFAVDSTFGWVALLPLTLLVGWPVAILASVAAVVCNPFAKVWLRDAIDLLIERLVASIAKSSRS